MAKRIAPPAADKPKPSKIPRPVRGGAATTKYGSGVGKLPVAEPFAPKLSAPKLPAPDATKLNGSDRRRAMQLMHGLPLPQSSIDTMEAFMNMDVDEWVEEVKQLGLYDESTRARGKALKEMHRRCYEFLPENGVLTDPNPFETFEDVYDRIMTPERRAQLDEARAKLLADPDVQKQLAELRKKVMRDYDPMYKGKGRADD